MQCLFKSSYLEENGIYYERSPRTIGKATLFVRFPIRMTTILCESSRRKVKVYKSFLRLFFLSCSFETKKKAKKREKLSENVLSFVFILEHEDYSFSGADVEQFFVVIAINNKVFPPFFFSLSLSFSHFP